MLRTCRSLGGLWTTAGMVGTIKRICLREDEMTWGLGAGDHTMHDNSSFIRYSNELKLLACHATLTIPLVINRVYDLGIKDN